MISGYISLCMRKNSFYMNIPDFKYMIYKENTFSESKFYQIYKYNRNNFKGHLHEKYS